MIVDKGKRVYPVDDDVMLAEATAKEFRSVKRLQPLMGSAHTAYCA